MAFTEWARSAGRTSCAIASEAFGARPELAINARFLFADETTGTIRLAESIPGMTEDVLTEEKELAKDLFLYAHHVRRESYRL